MVHEKKINNYKQLKVWNTQSQLRFKIIWEQIYT